MKMQVPQINESSHATVMSAMFGRASSSKPHPC